ncbi:MAG: hypothetical protein RI947_414 [Candidatus Parcubacteria bacterium]|jgi:prephenate dehydrogenase/chorismate mutase
MSGSDLSPLRTRLDAIDKQIAELLTERFEIAKEVGAVKKRNNAPITDTVREQALIQKLEQQIDDPLLKEYIEPIYRSVIASCKAPQQLFAYDTLPYSQIGIIGLGLIGGSIAKALRAKNADLPIYSLLKNPPRDTKTITKEVDMRTLVETCDLVVIASPIDTIISIAHSIASYASGRTQRLVVIDVASVKSSISEEFMKMTNAQVEFVPTHPMAGSEKSGYKASKASLFLHNPWVITPHEHNKNSTVDTLKDVIKYLGGTPVVSDAVAHDRNVAVVSHLVFLVSVYMFAFIATDYEEIMELAGSGFETTTRLASGNIEMHDQIFKHNTDNILQSLQDFIKFINSHRIDTSDSLDFFTAYKTSRDEYIEKKYTR